MGRDYIFIPSSPETAEKTLKSALLQPLRSLPKKDFLKAYCSIAYLYPGFHPDGWEQWEGPGEIRALLGEAWRRAGEGELTDNELYPYQASKAAINVVRKDVGLRPL